MPVFLILKCSIKISELTTWFKVAYTIQDKFYGLLHEKRTNLTKLITGKTAIQTYKRPFHIAEDLMNIKSKNEFFNHSTNQARKFLKIKVEQHSITHLRKTFVNNKIRRSFCTCSPFTFNSFVFSLVQKDGFFLRNFFGFF